MSMLPIIVGYALLSTLAIFVYCVRHRLQELEERDGRSIPMDPTVVLVFFLPILYFIFLPLGYVFTKGVDRIARRIIANK